MTPTTIPSCAGSVTGTVVAASCRVGIERQAAWPRPSRTPRASSFPRNCARTSSTPWSSGPAADDVAGGGQGAVEIVQDVEQVGQDRPLAALDLLRHVAAQARPRLLELGVGLAVARDRRAQLLVLRGQPLLELLDVRGLVGSLLRPAPAVGAVPFAHQRLSTMRMSPSGGPGRRGAGDSGSPPVGSCFLDSSAMMRRSMPPERSLRWLRAPAPRARWRRGRPWRCTQTSARHRPGQSSPCRRARARRTGSRPSGDRAPRPG